MNRNPKKITELLNNYKKEQSMVYSCSLCGLCDLLCPEGLRLQEIFYKYRKRLVDEGTSPSKNHLLYMTDKMWNIFTAYQDNYKIDYSDLIRTNCENIFFPGCAMSSFFPKITRMAFKYVESKLPSLGLMLDCCYKPLYDIGFQKRFEIAINELDKKITNIGANKVITACPTCYHVLKKNMGKEVISIYEILDENHIENKELKITIHDSCMDREKTIIGNQIRSLLRRFNITEMKHSKDKTICCGAGGLVACIDPDLCLSMVKRRLDEAKEARADLLLTYCYNCLLMLTSLSSKVKVSHILNLFFRVEENYSLIRSNLQKLFSGSIGKENYQKIFDQS